MTQVGAKIRNRAHIGGGGGGGNGGSILHVLKYVHHC
jgi:hypothetical protein